MAAEEVTGGARKATKSKLFEFLVHGVVSAESSSDAWGGEGVRGKPAWLGWGRDGSPCGGGRQLPALAPARALRDGLAPGSRCPASALPGGGCRGPLGRGGAAPSPTELAAQQVAAIPSRPAFGIPL